MDFPVYFHLEVIMFIYNLQSKLITVNEEDQKVYFRSALLLQTKMLMKIHFLSNINVGETARNMVSSG